MLMSCLYPDLLPPLPLCGGRWIGLAANNYVLLLPMAREKTGLQVESALRAIYPLVDYLPIGYSLSHHLMIVVRQLP